MNLFLIDGIAPFFHGYDKKRINWSKIPFANLERDGRLDLPKFNRILDEFEQFVVHAAEMGYNAITLDDVAHLALYSSYSEAMRLKIEDYRAAYRSLFAVASTHAMKVFITTDIMFYHKELEPLMSGSLDQIAGFMAETLNTVLLEFPEIAGVILRIGECDAHDVKDDFRSRLTIRTPRQARRFLELLLPVFEKTKRLMIVRTWTVGAYSIGDLIWNRNTFDRVFKHLNSAQLIISMKYGETDFFRYLPLNKLFYRSTHKKIIEFQARREYEGFGEYPSFVGWDCQGYRRDLESARNVIGLSVWCQTGGWGRFRRRTFLGNSSMWVEINVYVILKLFKENLSVEDAVRGFCANYLKREHANTLIQLLRLSDEVIKELLYIDEFAVRKMYFRRLRVPPLLTVYWDRVMINHHMRKILRSVVVHGDEKVRQGYDSLQKIKLMQQMAETIGLPVRDLEFQYDTYVILAVAREYYFGVFSPELRNRLESLRYAYRTTYAHHYSIQLDFTPVQTSRRLMYRVISILVRKRRGYRRLDRWLLIRLLSLFAILIRSRRLSLVPDFAHKQAMGLDAVLR